MLPLHAKISLALEGCDLTTEKSRCRFGLMENIKEGSMARLTTSSELSEHQPRTYRAGTQFEVEAFVDSEESEDGVPFYWGSLNGGINNAWFPADIVELVMSREQMDARTVPTPTEIMEQIWGDIAGDEDGIGRVSESTWNKDNTAEFFVQHDNGIEYAFTVAVTRVARTN